MQRRIKLLTLIMIFFGLFLTGKLVQIQLLSGDDYGVQAANMQQRLLPVETIPRGLILDRNLRPLTDSGSAQALVMFPSLVDDVEAARQQLHSVWPGLSLPTGTVPAYRQQPLVLKYHLTVQEAELLNSLGIPGLFVLPFNLRYGPDSLARHFVGHLTTGADYLVPVFGERGGGNGAAPRYSGAAGLERIYDPELSYGTGDRFFELFFDARGVLVPGLSFHQVQAPVSDRRFSLVLTLDREVQSAVETVMDGMVERGAVVVLDVDSGEVLAAASRPNYRQDNVQDYLTREYDPLRNRVLSSYHPGSLFKIVVAAAALEEGAAASEEVFTCTGSYRFESGLEIPCWEQDGHGRLTLSQALALSCNPTFIEVALRLGRSKLLAYAKRFGLEEEVLLGYPLPDVNALDIGYGPGALGNAAVGQQGVRVTPLQIAAATAVIASGGTWRQPRLVDKVIDDEGRIMETIAQAPAREVVSGETAAAVRSMMLLGTTEGTGTQAWLPEGTAGKTSSAETGRLDQDGQGIINAWFTGYVPAEEPRYVITVLVEGGSSGGSAAAPVFREVARYLLGHK